MGLLLINTWTRVFSFPTSEGASEWRSPCTRCPHASSPPADAGSRRGLGPSCVVNMLHQNHFPSIRICRQRQQLPWGSVIRGEEIDLLVYSAGKRLPGTASGHLTTSLTHASCRREADVGSDSERCSGPWGQRTFDHQARPWVPAAGQEDAHRDGQTDGCSSSHTASPQQEGCPPGLGTSLSPRVGEPASASPVCRVQDTRAAAHRAGPSS